MFTALIVSQVPNFIEQRRRSNEVTKLKEENVVVFPNPFNDLLKVTFPNLEYIEVKIFNSIGETMFVEKQNMMTLEINTEDWQPGLYFLNIYENDVFLKSEKLILVR